ncbi:MAG: FAD-dependent oxidoreductase [Sulfobacillus benefaciens]|uniref:FAD-dependent oxidoreductase n=1 Tax=Sulfobacillus benefaciens TaxID=453960 RepID=A0A2T2X541_9FIRM|nr:MAG: FAD-dependent oxidoreductase [Sulfobacillus benefaciens]
MKIGIIGAGPAGLSAAYELANHGQQVTVFEQDPDFVGGISRTVEYHGYRFDIGGHRFFSKSQEVEDFWTTILGDNLLTRGRISRIFYDDKFYDYPLKPLNAFRNMGVWNTGLCLLDYAKAKTSPPKNIQTFEDWVVYHFGRRLYEMFFKTYTEKVWGTPCDQISADWAAQRIKGLNLISAIKHAFFPQKTSSDKSLVVKTLIDTFRYPKLGPGMLWEQVAAKVTQMGGTLLMGQKVVELRHFNGRITSIDSLFDKEQSRITYQFDHVISTMPVRSLVRALRPNLPQAVTKAAEALKYRDFITVALVIDSPNLFPDNWIYIHDPKVKVGRIQNFGNWSPFMVPTNTTSCLGLEYFCFEGDGLWNSSDEALLKLAEQELNALGLTRGHSVIDGKVVRVPKAYPVYDEDYQSNVNTIVEYLRYSAQNLQLIGRNGMHRYNNQDHAMMTGFLAARNILGSNYDLWAVNGDAEYLEEVSEERQVPKVVAKT